MESKESNNIEKDSEPIKIILIGDSGTGKTNLITVSAGYEFNSNALTTRACSFIQKTFIKNNKEVKVNIWDTIGQEKYRSLTKIFVKESKIVIFVYDITNKKTFESLTFWKETINELLQDEPILGIVGNKMDLYVNEQISEEELEKFSKKTDSTSFTKFIDELLDDFLKKIPEERIQSFSLDKKAVKKKKKICC